MYVAFDMCNVLVDVKMDLLYSFLLEKNIFKNSDEINIFLKYTLGQADIGLFDVKTAFSNLLYIKKKPHDLLNEIMFLWKGIIHEVPEITDLLDRLKNKHNIKIALLSNISFEHADIFRNNLSPIFNSCFQHFSCDIGAKKPSKIYFQSFIKEQPGFNGCYFFDDVEENIIASQKNGFRAIQFGLNTYASFEDAAASLESSVLQYRK